MRSRSDETVILGGGLAGLTMARELLRAGRSVTVLERAPVFGGLARTLERDGVRFDLGGHRFHSNNPEVVAWAKELLGDDLIEVERRSRIYIGGKFVDYPIHFPGAFGIFTPLQAARVATSYLSTFFSSRDGGDVSFEDWVVRRFGRALYDVYFRPYTQKLWGIPCTELSADWASARISIPSLPQTLRHAIAPGRQTPRTAVRSFYYPRWGFGMICERLTDEIVSRGGRLLTRAELLGLNPGPDETEVLWKGQDGVEETIRCRRVISTIPLEALLAALPADSGAREVADRFRLDYRGIVLICLAIAKGSVSGDQWTYFPGGDLLIGRSHEPKNWSRDMIPRQEVTSLAVEVFSSEGEPAWSWGDDKIAGRAVAEIERIGWLSKGQVIGSWVLRVPYAYPLYRIGYAERVGEVRSFLQRYPGLMLVGRTGTFKYLNSDGVIEDCLKLLCELVPESAVRVRRLRDAGRWV